MFHVPGPCKVEWNDLDLGVCRAGVTITPASQWSPISYDLGGNSPLDFIFAGKAATCHLEALEPAKLDAMWDAIGGLFAMEPGTLASEVGKVLKITERDGSVWQADCSVPQDPGQLVLVSTSEIIVPVAFLIIPKWQNNRWELFSTVPSYLETA